MNTLKYLKETVLAQFSAMNKTPTHMEEHEVVNKVTGKTISTHPSYGAAYQSLMMDHQFNPNLTVLHHKSTQYRK